MHNGRAVPYGTLFRIWGDEEKGRVKDESVKRVDTKRKKIRRDEYSCAPSPLDNPTQTKGKEKRKEEKKKKKCRRKGYFLRSEDKRRHGCVIIKFLPYERTIQLVSCFCRFRRILQRALHLLPLLWQGFQCSGCYKPSTTANTRYI